MSAASKACQQVVRHVSSFLPATARSVAAAAPAPQPILLHAGPLDSRTCQQVVKHVSNQENMSVKSANSLLAADTLY